MVSMVLFDHYSTPIMGVYGLIVGVKRFGDHLANVAYYVVISPWITDFSSSDGHDTLIMNMGVTFHSPSCLCNLNLSILNNKQSLKSIMGLC